MEEFFHIVDRLKEISKDYLIATIIRVEGSAYRKEGTSILIEKNGTYNRMLSGGCLEDDLLARANHVDNRLSELIVYDMRSEDDLSWGQGAGCNGKIHILFESVDDELRKHMLKANEFLQNGIPVLLVKKISSSMIRKEYMFITENNIMFGNWSGSLPKEFLEQLKKNKFSGMIGVIEDSELFIHWLQPKPRIIIFGAGNDTMPLIHFASQVGFYTVLIDWRPALCNKTRFPNADEIFIGKPHEIIDEFLFRPQDIVIVMTHHFEKDKEILNKMKYKEIEYIGVLGTKQRTKKLLNGEEIPTWIHSPIGLSIGAEGPEEIAISILAEIIKITRLNDNIGNFH